MYTCDKIPVDVRKAGNDIVEQFMGSDSTINSIGYTLIDGKWGVSIGSTSDNKPVFDKIAEYMARYHPTIPFKTQVIGVIRAL